MLVDPPPPPSPSPCFNQTQVASQMGDVKAAKEVQVLAEFYKIMSEDETRAMYGYNHVCYADQQLAIKSLLVTDR